jgi:pimeloyl-ACP methyl ester carboxylesterase
MSSLPNLSPRTYGLPRADGTPVLVMLSGWPDSHELWSGVVGAFASAYHLVSLPTPDYDRTGLRSRWGYSPAEVVQMIEAAVTEHLGPTRAFDLLVHDWGCYWGYVLAYRHPSRVGKLVALDVGPPHRFGAERVRGVAWQLPYQLYFAFVFWIGARVSQTVAQALLVGMFRSGFWRLVGPLPANCAPMPRGLGEVQWWMCYPYFQVFYSLLLRLPMPRAPRMPAAPLLFLWGERKRCMFHSEEFLKRLAQAPGSYGVALDCGHWIQAEKPQELHAAMRDFLITKR